MSSPRRIGLPETMRMRHDTHFVEQLGAARRRVHRPADPDRGHRAQPRPAPPGAGRPLGADGVDPREGRARADPRAAGRAAASRSSPASAATARPSRRAWPRCPASCARASDAEMMELALVENLQRKDLTAVRRGGRPQRPRRDVRLHPRGDGREAGQEPHPRSPRRCRWPRCRRRSGSCVGWPTFSLSPFFYRSLGRAIREKMVALVERLRARRGHASEARRIAARRGATGTGRPRHFVFRFNPQGGELLAQPAVQARPGGARGDHPDARGDPRVPATG